MTSVSAVDNNIQANYNAVKIKINKPKTIIPEGFKSTLDNNGIYNAVNIEVDEPTVEVEKDCKKCKRIYDYPKSESIVTYDMAGLEPVYIVDLPVPLAYQANLINNRTFVAADIIMDKADKSFNKELEIEVPAPNVTTTEAEKKTPNSQITFNGISFKGNNKVEIVPPVEINPDVNISKVIDNLISDNFDVQAQQMEEIARLAMEDSQKAIPFIVTDIFNILIDIASKDTSDLATPSKEQIETRKKIIINELVKEQAAANGQSPDKIELPYNLTKEEMISAATISPLEQAERNKEYALYTIAILSKIFADEVEKETGNVVPLTDLPGISEVVNELRYNENLGVKIAAIEALRHIARPEYEEELTEVFRLAAKDSDEQVAMNAKNAMQAL